MGIRGIIEADREAARCQSPYEGRVRLQVRLDVCFIAAEHNDWPE